MSEYILGTEDRRRLELLEQSFDPITLRSLDAIGVEPGWRCLEVGAGGGSVTRMLCRRVGPSGRVAAVDLDTRFVEELGEENLDVHRQDVLADGLPGDAYDLIHARLLLMHLPTREKFVEQMASALRPGGWLLIEEVDIFPVTVLAQGLYADLWTAVVPACETAGVSLTFGRELPALFDRARLEDVEVACEVPVFRGGTAPAAFAAVSLEQLRPLLVAAGATDAQLDQWGRLFDDPTEWFSLFAMYSVRGRTPTHGGR